MKEKKNENRKVSEHLWLSEVECHCGCKKATVDKNLVKQFEGFRSELNKQLSEKYKSEIFIDVHCINRCLESNEKLLKNYFFRLKNKLLPNLKPSRTSLHIFGMACDCHAYYLRKRIIGKGFKKVRIPVKELHTIALSLHNKKGILYGGLGFYSTFVHFDTGRFRSWGKPVI